MNYQKMLTDKLPTKDISLGKKFLFIAYLIVVPIATLVIATMVNIQFLFVFYLKKRHNYLYNTSCLWAKIITSINPVWNLKFKESQLAKEIPGPAIYVCNHQSNMDVLAIMTLEKKQFRWISKDSLFKIPLFGSGMHAVGHIPVKRGDKSSGEKCLEIAKDRLKNGEPIIFFPEGTRNSSGTLKPFKGGAFRLAKELNLPIIPMAIDGTGKMLPKGSFFPKESSISLSILDPIYPQNFEVHELTQMGFDAINKELTKLQESA